MGKLFTSCVALAMLFGLSANAQTNVSVRPGAASQRPAPNPLLSTSKAIPMPGAKQGVPSPKLHKAPTQGQVWWGYWNGQSPLTGMGMGRADTYHAAEHLNSPLVNGRNIKAVRAVVDGVSSMADLKVWVSSALPASGPEADVAVIDVDLADVEAGVPFDVELPEVYQVGDDGVFVGVTFTITAITDQGSFYPVMVTNSGSYQMDHLYVRTDQYIPDWQDVWMNGFGDMGVQVLIDGEFEENAVALSNFTEIVAEKNTTSAISLPVQNQGLNAVSTLSYTLTLGGKTSEERQLTLDTPFEGFYANTTLTVPAEAAAAAGLDTLVVTVTKVNGETLATPATARGAVVTVDESAKRTPLVEFSTSTIQGLSPAEVTATELLREEFPDVAIIKYHVNDPMFCTWFWGWAMSFQYVPGARVNRAWEGLAYWGDNYDLTGYGLGEVVAAQQKEVAEATIAFDGTPVLHQDGTIDVKSNITYGYDREDNPYYVEFVVLSSDLTGNEPEWVQLNSFPQYKGQGYFDDDPNLQEWLDGEESIEMLYDDVAFRSGGYDPLPTPIVKGQPMAYQAVVDITGDGMIGSTINPMAQELGQLKVVAVLYNQNTGKVVNVAETTVDASQEFAEDAVSVADMPNVFVLEGGEQNVNVTLKRDGQHPVTDIDYVVTVNGEAQEEQHMEASIYGFNGTTDIQVPVEALSTPGSLPVSISVTKVNGVENGSANAKGDGLVATLSRNAHRRPVIEEYTGGWCGWCPRGAIGLALAKAQFGDDVVTYAMHFRDAMQCEDLEPLWGQVYAYPTAQADRESDIDPYFGVQSKGYHLDEVITYQQAAITEATVYMSTPYINASRTAITVGTNTVFGFSAPTSDYALSFVLIADSLRGEGDDWIQYNTYANLKDSPNYGDDENLTEILNAETAITDYVYNEVAIQASNPFGVEGSIEGPLVRNEPNTFTYTFDISENPLIQNINNLKVAALLINTKSGRIVNAVENHVSFTTDITSVGQQENDVTAVYTANGTRVNGLQKGVNIVKMANGTTRKVMKK